jgi:hypothetical protein
MHQKMLDWIAARLDDAVNREERERASQQKNPFNMAVSGGGSKRSSDSANSALCKTLLKPKCQEEFFVSPEDDLNYAIMCLLAEHNLASRVILSSESFANVLKCARLVGANFRPANHPAFSMQNWRLGKWLQKAVDESGVSANLSIKVSSPALASAMELVSGPLI